MFFKDQLDRSKAMVPLKLIGSMYRCVNNKPTLLQVPLCAIILVNEPCTMVWPSKQLISDQITSLNNKKVDNHVPEVSNLLEIFTSIVPTISEPIRPRWFHQLFHMLKGWRRVCNGPRCGFVHLLSSAINDLYIGFWLVVIDNFKVIFGEKKCSSVLQQFNFKLFSDFKNKKCIKKKGKCFWLAPLNK